ncbi:hypothetical protein GLOTRDRAFT_93350 [Gloeophyllum trabeum ATCC 11539]|uniref:Uncharacterized protein n=1 Tax=Gloeophyllum trabeum (strain ATCC 11539 / FP-39264 / Madison 617) TaxID=670483 RepID=S7Q6Y8_GLOTA|nr:uncharacterized protein GLOTRDRAFT_93350 [Gloeophyllum trabeum ATCC 11539]EPQ55801.1 hypothetical protein GLOTRDRAFT_93350 [Gloeophyllum trabeum ATCC 11539]
MAWAEDSTPWQAWVVQTPFIKWDGPFERLDVTKASVPLVKGPGGWHLQEGLLKRWTELEERLVELARLFATRLSLHSLSLKPFWLPTEFGLREPFQGKKCGWRVIRCHDAFVPLAAYVSYMAAILEYKWDTVQYQPGYIPSKAYEIAATVLPPDWVDTLFASALMSAPGPSRAGLVIIQKHQWWDDFPVMAYADVPLFFYWCSYANFAWTQWNTTTAPELWPYCPTVEMVERMCRATPGVPGDSTLSPPPLRSLLSSGDAPHAGTTSSSARHLVRQKIPGSSGQYEGEKVWEFMARWDKERMRRFTSASSRQLQQWRLREANSKTFPFPAKAKVYKWVNIDEVKPVHLRHVVMHSDVTEEYWESLDRSRLVFNPINNEWDVDDAIDPKPVTARGYELLDESDEEFFGDEWGGDKVVVARKTGPSTAGAPDLPAPLPPLHLVDTFLQLVLLTHPQQDGSFPDPQLHLVDSLLQLVHSSHPRQGSTLPKPPLHLADTLPWLVLSNCPRQAHLRIEEHPPILTPSCRLQRFLPVHPQQPHLRLEGPRDPADMRLGHITKYRHLPANIGAILTLRYGLLASPEGLRLDIVWVSSHPEFSKKLSSFMVEKASGAYSQEFMDKVITFMKNLCTGGGQGTLSHCDLTQGPLQTPLNVRRLPADETIYYAMTPPDGPGVWVTTAVEAFLPFVPVFCHIRRRLSNWGLLYNNWCYVSQRDSFIVSHPHSRAALLLSGMMWCLALDALHGTAEDVVCAGPSEAAIENGFGRLVTHVDGTSGWYEEHIDPLEEACIIGTYSVETSPGHQQCGNAAAMALPAIGPTGQKSGTKIGLGKS